MSLGPIAPTAAGGGGAVIAPAASTGSGVAQGPASAAIATPSLPPPEAALSALVGEAVALQDSLAPLLADLGAALQSDVLPPAARATAQQILQSQTPLDATVSAQDLRAAISQSGVFLEAALAAAVRTTGPAAAQPPALDLKALLLQLPADLASQDQAAAQQAAPLTARQTQIQAQRASRRPPPPIPGGPTRGQPPAEPSLESDADASSQIHALTQDAHAALARLQLSQLASLPRTDGTARWSFELPVASDGGTAMAQFEISRDGGGQPGADPAAAVWRARFSLNLEPSGPVHAEISLTAGRTRATLWAEREGARAQMSAGQAELVAALAGETAGDAAVRVLGGAPAATPPPDGAGRYVNRTS